MINLSTKDEVLLKELKSDFNRIKHWLANEKYSSKKLRQRAYELQRRCIDQNLPFATSGYDEYTTKNGNRWIVYQKATRYGDDIIPELQAFCYYDTFGSGGAFVPSYSKGNVDSCIIFTSHFFLRVKQRLGLSAMNRDVIQRFIEYISTLHSEAKGEGKHGKNEVIIYLNGAIGYGTYRDKECNILEVKSFLKETELTSYQKRESNRLVNIAKNYIQLHEEAAFNRLLSGDMSVMKAKEDNCRLVGENEDYLDKMIFIIGVTMTIAKEYSLVLDEKKLIDWLSRNLKTYHNIITIVYGEGWGFNHTELGRMVKDAIREMKNYEIPLIGYIVKLEATIYSVMDVVTTKMNERRINYNLQ